ncbi:hypothetical protein SAICODRAFT_30223 [Saitoella complicata NRRL Y-17804]|uniref:Uncharacterized protein n=1 Tax=Saitoella complicata (strain BCRC 22490 / CBS 7301 / JCM 7358 / NBRC 10748 / NRRL Y-17804) TaxID=698492 RepID=A0A0E9N8Y0_SAICN|nr:uncharacterized protein SAICODRAFT_30223 [Saitoella complicata NRRL Y-17804]ODQ53137.1 hypothetical protein SAICODRAFT_30223 [Saitoella complicata NRRL Y-17804]GAO46258.1 hypothetical protein G7K_0493-t1 [Saitoella complicata NRRL Y-17804]
MPSFLNPFKVLANARSTVARGHHRHHHHHQQSPAAPSPTPTSSPGSSNDSISGLALDDPNPHPVTDAPTEGKNSALAFTPADAAAFGILPAPPLPSPPAIILSEPLDPNSLPGRRTFTASAAVVVTPYSVTVAAEAGPSRPFAPVLPPRQPSERRLKADHAHDVAEHLHMELDGVATPTKEYDTLALAPALYAKGSLSPRHFLKAQDSLVVAHHRLEGDTSSSSSSDDDSEIERLHEAEQTLHDITRAQALEAEREEIEALDDEIALLDHDASDVEERAVAQRAEALELENAAENLDEELERDIERLPSSSSSSSSSEESRPQSAQTAPETQPQSAPSESITSAPTPVASPAPATSVPEPEEVQTSTEEELKLDQTTPSEEAKLRDVMNPNICTAENEAVRALRHVDRNVAYKEDERPNNKRTRTHAADSVVSGRSGASGRDVQEGGMSRRESY